MPRITKKSKLLELITKHGWTRIGEPEWSVLCAAIPEIAPDDLQRVDIPVDPPWHGVHQHTLDDLEKSLTSLTQVYSSRADLRRFCRATVILAKDRAKWAARSSRVSEDKRQLKAEMAEWMLIWLGDPSLFPAWVQLRRRSLVSSHSTE